MAPSEQSKLTLELAQQYIARGWTIVAAHVPIFSESGRVGCSCEEYKRSEKYREWLESRGEGDEFDPNYICKSPGKHPRGKWRSGEGIGPDKLHDTWGRFHTVTDVDTGKRIKVVWNIGTLTGPSGLLSLDVDSYKEVFNCDLSDFISVAEQDTQEQKSHSGGTHLFYNREGKPYTNARSGLPDGIDIRGVGGFIMLAPSVGPSGNRYEWAEGSAPWETQLLPIPQALDEILSQTAQKAVKAAKVIFTEPTTTKPALSQWRLSKQATNAIFNPAERGQRSEADMSVCVSLCFAGATDDEILGVFEHYPIGTEGKFAERGRGYLAHTIGQARAFAEANPRPDVSAIIARELYRAETETLIPQSDGVGKGSGDTDRKLYINLLRIMQERSRVTGLRIGIRQLSMAPNSDGVSVVLCAPETVRRWLERANGVLIDYTTEVQSNNLPLTVISLTDTVINKRDTLEHSISYSNPIVSRLFTTGNVQEYLADDAFLTGRSRLVNEQIEANMKALCFAYARYAEARRAYQAGKERKPADVHELRALMGGELLATYQELKQRSEEEFLKSLGTYGLIVLDDVDTNPGTTRKEIAERRGLKASSVGTALRKLEAWALVESEQGFGRAKVYTAVGDVWGEVKERTPEAMSYTLGAQRADRQLEQAQQHAKANLEAVRGTDDEPKAKLRLAKIENKRFGTVPVIYPNFDPSMVADWIYGTSTHADYMGRESQQQAAPAQMAGEPTLKAFEELRDLESRRQAGNPEQFTMDDYSRMKGLDNQVGGGFFSTETELEQVAAEIRMTGKTGSAAAAEAFYRGYTDEQEAQRIGELSHYPTTGKQKLVYHYGGTIAEVTA